ncbi:MAG: glycosyltransferase [Desulfobacterales bacterium]|nr:glycosyltransferase [Desulfobacterales bacterium]
MMDHDKPLFSIIIPTYSRPRQLTSCLCSIVRMDYPVDRFEVIVVDDGSEKSPEAIVRSFREHIDITLLSESHAGPAAARNTGAARAKGAYLAFTDDDCAPELDWLQNLTARFSKTSDCAIGGRTVNALPDNSFSTTSQLLVDYLHSYYNIDFNRAHFLTSNNLAMPADRFHAIGGFDHNFFHAGGEDRDICEVWLHHGYRMLYAPEIIVRHTHKLTLASFWKQHLNYGRGAFRFHQKRFQRVHKSIRLEPLSFYMNLLRYPFSLSYGRRTLLLMALFVLSQVANAVGFVYECGIRSKR